MMDDSVTLDRAWSELNRPNGVPIATLHAAEWLAKYCEPERLRNFLLRRGAAECAAILKHLERKRCR